MTRRFILTRANPTFKKENKGKNSCSRGRQPVCVRVPTRLGGWGENVKSEKEGQKTCGKFRILEGAQKRKSKRKYVAVPTKDGGSSFENREETEH